jgi:IS5 family transposase
MQYADQVLADEALVTAVYDALSRRHPRSKSRGRLGAPADMVLRLLILKHIRNWSYDVLDREVRANLTRLRLRPPRCMASGEVTTIG